MHFAKYTASGAVGLRRHYEREGGDFADMLTPNKKSNTIDWNRTQENYNLAPHRDPDFIKQRCSEVRCLQRSDVKVLCDWVVTIPQKLLQEHPEREHEFFEMSYKYLSDKYGAENVVSACVHRDETTPHLHFAWVPVVADQKRGEYKVSAKECVTRADLKRIHSDMSEYLSKEMGIEVNLLTGGTISKDLTVDQLKSNTIQDIQDLQQQRDDMQSRYKEFSRKCTEKQIELYELQDELKDTRELLDKVRMEYTGVLDKVMQKESELSEIERDIDAFLSAYDGIKDTYAYRQYLQIVQSREQDPIEQLESVRSRGRSR